jgi:hypothetical protein
LDQYYSNERLKTIGRDVAEAPIRRLQKEAISEELSPLKNRVAEIEKAVHAVRSMAEDLLGRFAQLSLGTGGVLPEATGEILPRLEAVVAELAGYARQLGGGAAGVEVPAPHGGTSLHPELVRELDQIKNLSATLAIRAIKSTVLAIAQDKLGPEYPLRVRWEPETGVEIYAGLVVVGEVRNPEREISLDEARRLGLKSQLGSKVWMRKLKGLESVEVVARTANLFLFLRGDNSSTPLNR